MTDTTVAASRGFPWLRDAGFDNFFIFGIAALAILTGIIVVTMPELFIPILIADLWFLGYHHVISTFTRLCFDKKSFRENRFLVLGLTPIIAVATTLVAWQFGLWVIVTIYFYWQWWHYTRQSWGISRAYRGKDSGGLYDGIRLDQAIFYSLPVFGILYRSNQGQNKFIGFDLWSVPVPDVVVTIAAVACVALLAIWVVRRVQALRENRLAVVHTYYMLSHFVIFGVGYVVIEDITYGWLVINMWHNAQYILFVWMYNSKRFRNGVDPDAKFLSAISQPGRLWLYLVTCLAITGLFYWGLRTIDWLLFAGLSATLVIYQIVNFHHYVVDSVIWKMRKRPMRKVLGLEGGS
jgi:hypothetical protein